MFIFTEDKYEFCLNYARTMMLMSKLMAEKYGLENPATQSYVKKGIQSCKLAIYYKRLMDRKKAAA